MIFRIFQPAFYLTDVVDYYWYSRIETTSAMLQSYPTPLLQGLTFNFQEKIEHHRYDNKTVRLDKIAYIFGQPVSHRTVKTHESGVDILGVKFKPLGISKITGINMQHIADRFVAADDIWGSEIESISDHMHSCSSLEKRIEILQSFLFGKYRQTRQSHYDDCITNALTIFENHHGSMPMNDLLREINMTRKTFERHFLNDIGLTPKLYAQIIRFNAAKDRFERLAKKQKLSDIALDLGFYDSSHFTAQFKRFSGLTPRSFLQQQGSVT